MTTVENMQQQIQAIMKTRRSNDVDRVIKSIMRWSPYTDKKELMKAAAKIKIQLAESNNIVKKPDRNGVTKERDGIKSATSASNKPLRIEKILPECIDSCRLYTKEILDKSGYENPDGLTDILTIKFHSHGYVIQYDLARQLGLKVEKHDVDIESWDLMRLWLSKYINTATDRHYIRYIIPKPKNDKELESE